MAKSQSNPNARRGRVWSFLVLAATVAIVPLVTAQQVVLFSDDFEHGTASWELDPGWQISLDGANHVLQGGGHSFAQPLRGDELGSIEVFDSRFRIGQGGMVVAYRLSKPVFRYFVFLGQGQISLNKTTSTRPGANEFTNKELCGTEAPIELGRWYSLRITGEGNHIEVFLEGEKVLQYTDQDSPYLSGSVWFESLDGADVMVDDVVLKGQSPPRLQWTFTGGPPGGIGYDVRIDPRDANVLWVTDAYAGVHRSVDGGGTWVAGNNGITARANLTGDSVPIFSLTIDHRNPDTIWVGVLGMRGVFKTTDGGANWVEMDNGIATQPSMEFRGFTVDPRDSNIVYCGGNYLVDPATLKQRGFIYKTTDGGRSWMLLYEPGALVRWIIVDPTDSNVIYASTGIFDRFAVKAEGVLKSVDGGKTWTNINNGLTSLAVAALAMHPTNPSILIAGTGKAGAFEDSPGDLVAGVFKTTDGGQLWRQVDTLHLSDGGGTRFSAVAFSPSNPDIVFADAGHLFLRSTNGGESWEVINIKAKGDNRGQPIALAVHPTNPDWIYMNSYDGGVFASTDGGRTWNDSSSGYTGLRAWDVAIDPSHPENVVVSGKNGVHVSNDAGRSWRGRYTASWVSNTLAVAVDPTASDRWLAGAQIDGSIARTTDGGDSWAIVLPQLGVDTITGRRSIYRLAFAPSAPETVYAATGVDTMFVQTPLAYRGPGIFKSVDRGATWTAFNRGLEGTSQTALSLAIHPQDASVVYIGLLDKGVYKTTDGGATWRPANQGLSTLEIRSLAIDPFNPNIVLAGAERGGVWRSNDAGASWKQLSYGIPAEANVRAIVFDLSHFGVVYAGETSSGVYRSGDGGTTWATMSGGLSTRAVNSLALSTDGLHLYAATEGAGVFRLDTNEIRRPRRRPVRR